MATTGNGRSIDQSRLGMVDFTTESHGQFCPIKAFTSSLHYTRSTSTMESGSATTIAMFQELLVLAIMYVVLHYLTRTIFLRTKRACASRPAGIPGGRRLRWQRGRNPSGFAFPNPSPRENRKPVPVPSPCAGLVFCPSPKPIGFRGTHGEPMIKSKYLNKHSGDKE